MDKNQRLWQPEPMPLNRNTAVYRIAAKISHAFGVRYHDSLYGEKNLLSELPVVTSSLALDIRKAVEREIRDVALLQGGDTLSRFEFAVATGSSCYIAWVDGEPAGYSWTNNRVMMMDRHKAADVPPSGSFHFNSFIFPQFRGNKIFQCLIYHVYMDLKAQGCKFAGNFVDLENTASIKVRQNFGALFQPAKMIKLPGFRLFAVGRRFIPGASLEVS